MRTLSQSWSTMSSFFQNKQLSFAGWMLLWLTGILLFVFSLPHVMALRKLLLLIAFLLAFKSFWDALRKQPKPLLSAVVIFVLLQVWMLVVAGFIANQPVASFSVWIGQWLPTMMSFVIGVGLAHTLMLSKLKAPRVVVAMSILIPITIYLSVNAVVLIHEMILTGKFIPQGLLGGIADHHGISGHLLALLEPILIADILSRLLKGNRLLPVSGWIISAILTLGLATLIATTNRNGILIMLLAVILGVAMTISEIRKVYSAKKIITFTLATLIFVLAMAVVSYKTDPRWQTFIETLPIAWDIDHDLLWLNGNDASTAPFTPSGKQVDISEYNRIALAHEGWRMLMAHPWGMEIARDTFHKLELAKYGRAEMAHSHNSWIDFGLNVGIQGVLLWAVFLILLAQKGWRTWKNQNEPLGLALAVLVIMFAASGLIDSIFRDHEIEQFMLVAGLLFSALAFEPPNKITQTKN